MRTPTDHLIELSTIQPHSFYTRSLEEGVLRADPSRLRHPDFTEAYTWMNTQMKERLPSYKGHPPIWCWVGSPPAEYLEVAGDDPEGPFVIIYFNMPFSQILVSDYDRWETVLLGAPVAPLESDYEEFIAMRHHQDTLDPEGFWRIYQKFVRDTWSRVFCDLEATILPAGRYLQAVVEEVPLTAADVKIIR